jgi:hypothetical protein
MAGAEHPPLPALGLGRLPLPDAGVDAWLRDVERYVFDLEARRVLRERYLTAEEIAEAEAYEADPL